MRWRRLQLTREDGAVYLDRWGLMGKWGSIYLHRMTAPDPGMDLHDHPWAFLTIPLVGGYREARNETRYENAGPAHRYSRVERVRQFRPKLMRLDECHRILELHRTPTWTLVITGPKRRTWGFYEPDGWIRHTDFHTDRRPMAATLNKGLE